MTAKVNIHIDNYDSLDGEYEDGMVLTTDSNSPIGVSFQQPQAGGGQLTINDTISNLQQSGYIYSDIIANENSNDSIEVKYFNVKSNYANSISTYNTSINTYYVLNQGSITDYYHDSVGDGGVTRANKHIWAKNWNQLQCHNSSGSFAAISCYTNSNSNFDAINYDFYQNSSIYLEQDFFIPINGYENSTAVFCGLFSGTANNMFVSGNESSILNIANPNFMPTNSSFFGIGAYAVDTNLQLIYVKQGSTTTRIQLPFTKDGLTDVNGNIDGYNGYFRVKMKIVNENVKIQLIRVSQSLKDNNFVEIDLSQNLTVKEALNLVNSQIPTIKKVLAPTLFVATFQNINKKVAFSKMFYEKGSISCVDKHFVDMSDQEKIDFPSQFIQA